MNSQRVTIQNRFLSSYQLCKVASIITFKPKSLKIATRKCISNFKSSTSKTSSLICRCNNLTKWVLVYPNADVLWCEWCNAAEEDLTTGQVNLINPKRRMDYLKITARSSGITAMMWWKARTVRETQITNAMKAPTEVEKGTDALRTRLNAGLRAGVGKLMVQRAP